MEESNINIRRESLSSNPSISCGENDIKMDTLSIIPHSPIHENKLSDIFEPRNDSINNYKTMYDEFKNYSNKTKKIIKILEKKKNDYLIISKIHSKNETFYNKLFYSFGFIQVILVTVITTLSGTNGIIDNKSTYHIISFWIGLITTILSIISTFFKLEDRSSKHNVSSTQYSELVEDLSYDLITLFDEQKLIKCIEIYNEKEKFINAYESNLSGSILLKYLIRKYKKPLLNLDNNINSNLKLIKNELYKNLNLYKYMRDIHKFNEELYSYLYITFQYPQALLTGILTVITGVNGIDLVSSNNYDISAFIFSLVATIISITRSIFRFQKSSSLHHSAMEQYSNLGKDLKSKLLIGVDDIESAENLLNEYKEKVKFIKSYEPSFSRCVSYNK